MEAASARKIFPVYFSLILLPSAMEWVLGWRPRLRSFNLIKLRWKCNLKWRRGLRFQLDSLLRNDVCAGWEDCGPHKRVGLVGHIKKERLPGKGSPVTPKEPSS